MPKNSKSVVNISMECIAICPCGFDRKCNDIKGYNTITKLHKKVCEISRNCKTETIITDLKKNIPNGNITEKIRK